MSRPSVEACSLNPKGKPPARPYQGAKAACPILSSAALAGTIVLIGFALRAYRLGYQSLWFDEAGTLYWATHGISGLTGDFNPPLYYALVSGWIQAAGTSEFALRYPSLLFSVCAVALLVSLVRRHGSQSVAIGAGLMLATSPFAVYYAQETRMYSLAMLLTLILAWCAPLVGKRRGAAVAYGITAWAGIHTHYFFAIPLALANGWWLVSAIRRRYFQSPRVWLAVHVAVVIATMPWMLLVAQRALVRSDFWRVSLPPYELALDFLRSFAFGEAWMAHLDASWTIAIALVAGATGLLYSRARGVALFGGVALLVSWALMAFAPQPIYTARYLIVVLPAFSAFVGCALAGVDTARPARGQLEQHALAWNDRRSYLRRGEPVARPNRGDDAHPSGGRRAGGPREAGAPRGGTRSRPYSTTKAVCSISPHFALVTRSLAVVGFVLIVGALHGPALQTLYGDSRFQRDDYRTLANRLDQIARRDDPVVYLAGRMDLPFRYYFAGSGRDVILDDTRRYPPGERPPAVLQLLEDEEVDRIWLVRSIASADFINDPQGAIPATFADAGAVPTADVAVKGLVAVLYEKASWKGRSEASANGADFGETLRLDAAQVDWSPRHPSVALYWEALRPISERLSYSVQILRDGRLVGQQDGVLGGRFAEALQRARGRQRDVVELPHPGSVEPVEIAVAVYRPETGERLRTRNDYAFSPGLARIAVLGPPSPTD